MRQKEKSMMGFAQTRVACVAYNFVTFLDVSDADGTVRCPY
jgi:hypothetical protein